MKKAWEKPKLVVLVRGKPEEAILNGCKDWAGPPPNGPVSDYTQCMEGTANCIECFADSES
jgi:hypothetical protein